MKGILTLTGLFLYLSVRAQVMIPGNTRADIRFIQKDCLMNQGNPSEEAMERFAIQRIKEEYFVSFLGEKKEGFIRSDLALKGIIPGAEIGSVISLRIPLAMLDRIHEIHSLRSIQLAGKIKPIRSHSHHSEKEFGGQSSDLSLDLPTGYSGKNVLIGLSDWGFDYTSPIFYDTLRRFSRILAVWDQFKTSGPPPSGYTYGTEYASIPEYCGVGTDTTNIQGSPVYGTLVAGVSGGSGFNTPYRGIAQSAQFLFASFLPDEASVLDTWEWMFQKSLIESKRLVIQISWGVYHIGTLDGTSLLSQAIDAYASLGVVFCGAAGNNGTTDFHIKKNFSNDSIRSMIGFYRDARHPNVWGQSIHAWGEPGNSFECGLQFYTNSGNTLIKQTPYYSSASGVNFLDTFWIYGKDTIFYIVSSDVSHPQNGRPQMRIRVKNPFSLKVLLVARANSGIVHFWNVTETTEYLADWGMAFVSSGSETIAGDNNYGIFEPTCSNTIIAVSAYLPPPSGSVFGIKEARASFSSLGPRYDNVLKPEIAAPGVNIITSISSFSNQTYTSHNSIYFNGRTYHFAPFSSTSCSSAIVAGVVALILEANPSLSVAQVRNIIFETAREDNFTGVIPVNGSTQWGWGKIDPKIALKLALLTTGTEKPELETDWGVYPNPANKFLFFTLVDELPDRVEIIDDRGRVILRKTKNASVYVGDLRSGIYFVRLERNGHVQQVRFVKN